MTIHKEGYPTILLITLVSGALALATHLHLAPVSCVLAWIAYAILLFFWLFIISFFRLPKRIHSFDENAIIAPADGKVVVIEETVDQEYFKEKRLQISVFMSPANVHVNRNPISGEVVYNQYHKGKYLVAWHPKSSTENERHSIVIKKGNKEILVKQIAGALAKRIMNYTKVGQEVKQTEEMGFIKFGSRVDLLLPIGTKINAGMNDAVKGGVSVIATL
jgi:phosphatidylserine decarboxylase